jgi:hypothetical protein
MKGPQELNTGNMVLNVLKSAQDQGADIKNILQSIMDTLNIENDGSTLPVDPKKYINKNILYNVSFDDRLRKGVIKKITSKGYLCVEENIPGMPLTIPDMPTTVTQYYDPRTLYIQDVLEDGE